jgi:hypothetical protein
MTDPLGCLRDDQVGVAEGGSESVLVVSFPPNHNPLCVIAFAFLLVLFLHGDGINRSSILEFNCHSKPRDNDSGFVTELSGG